MSTGARKTWGAGALVALAAAFLALTIVVTFALRGARLDLTASRLYTIAPGTERIVGSLTEPVNLYFFLSDEASRSTPALRAYAQRVRELLEEMAQRSNGKLRLTVIDPQPFSEDEDRATDFGLAAVPVGTNGEPLYFGLAGTNSTDGRETIGFFQPDKEEFLEYDVASLVYRLAHPKKPVVGLLSTLPVDASFDQMTGQMREGWAAIQQTRELFDVRAVAGDAKAIDPDIGVLLLVHPKDLPPATLYAIDQFVMRGGKLLAFVDPVAESERPADPMGGLGGDRGSDLAPLFAAWGIAYDPKQVIGDLAHALTVSMRQGEPPAPHVAVLALGNDAMAQNDVITRGLQAVNVMTAGTVAPKDGSKLEFEPLLRTSAQSAPIPAGRLTFMTDPGELLEGFTPTGKQYAIAARVHGRLKSAYPDGLPANGTAPGNGLKETKGAADLVIVADTDILSDMLWIRRQNLFGQAFAVAWANNGDLLANMLDNLAGSDELISVRGRQSFFRPFTRVDELRRRADERLREKEQELDRELKDTEQNLTALEAARGDAGAGLVLTREQQAELERFQAERLRIRRELRDVRRGLDVEIDRLGTMLKTINITLVPALLAIGALLLAGLRRRRFAAGRAADRASGNPAGTRV